MNQQKFPELKALVFDVQGTATDFRSTLAEEAARLSRGRAGDFDWGAFVDEWRGMYRPALDEVLAGTRPWTPVDLIYREALDRLLTQKGLSFFSEAERAELNKDEFYLHKFRATRATRLLQGGMDIKSVQQMLGHNDLESTMRYLGAQRTDVLQAQIEQIDSL